MRRAIVLGLWVTSSCGATRTPPPTIATFDLTTLLASPARKHTVTGVEAVELSLGSHSCARMRERTVRCWGSNTEGQLGVEADPRLVPKPVEGLLAVVQISAGPSHTCARQSGATVKCWGSNGLGQLGDGSRSFRAEPRSVRGLTGVAQVAVGEAHTCARRFDGTVYCWGFNASGQLGDGSVNDRAEPVAVMGFGASRRAVQLAVGHFHACALTEDDEVWCWGFNGSGQLGDGTIADRPAPVRVHGIPETAAVERVSLGRYHSCALMGDGTAWCWGLNSAGQLGDGTTTDRTTPVPVSRVRDFVEVALGDMHTCARRIEGAVFCWGANDDGQLGDGTRDNRTAPAQVTALGDAAQIALGERHTCARDRAGDVSCWGDNTHGALGDGTTTDRTVPTPVMW